VPLGVVVDKFVVQNPDWMGVSMQGRCLRVLIHQEPVIIPGTDRHTTRGQGKCWLEATLVTPATLEFSTETNRIFQLGTSQQQITNRIYF